MFWNRNKPKKDPKELKVMLLDGNRKLLASIRDYLADHKLHINYVSQDKCNECEFILIVLGNVTLAEMRKKLHPSQRSKAIVVIKPAAQWNLARDRAKAERLEEEIRNLGYSFVAIGTNNHELAAFVLKEILERRAEIPDEEDPEDEEED